ncbi:MULTISPECIES: hypothetical protein [Roseobacteraceae]|jgi:hypothetical protein|uniref:Uncharacterized protein n=1 Tax=Pseudosulfitobacter pseudonitzschiae TaxID=1402135 RepID=A0A221JZK4_9RHOB|nr:MULTISPECIES: hypothetical protein [Roseobacteraceae]ASM72172.1 hypothetical protein SULPSESMR1_01352 [Pseudosulfitobacter pseudonitzschiae]
MIYGFIEIGCPMLLRVCQNDPQSVIKDDRQHQAKDPVEEGKSNFPNSSAKALSAQRRVKLQAPAFSCPA